MRLEDLGLIGNCRISALVSREGEIVWCCLPRFDSEPVFSTLLDLPGGGFFRVAPAQGGAGRQRYLPNTNVLETTFEATDGRFRILDFAPRWIEGERALNPPRLVRLVEPLEGEPLVRVACEPRLGWSRARPSVRVFTDHLAFEGFAAPMELAFGPGRGFAPEASPLRGRAAFVLGWGDLPAGDPLAQSDRWLDATVRYWRRWVRHCNIPPLFQAEVIRSALALKLHCFEQTGAIVAAMTTSIPEAPGSGRTWDYRYCWLRDASYVLAALRRLGHFEEREHFVRYLLEIAAANPALDLAPLYRVDGTTDLEERVLDDWNGYQGERPVRVGNAAVSHRQNDVFGEMVLALAPVWMDERFHEERTPEALDLLERMARKAIAVAGTPDAGIWEYRTGWRPQTFSSLMSWAGADRMARVAEAHAPERAGWYRGEAERIRQEMIARAWNPELGSFAASYGGTDLDAALLQMAPLHFLDRDDRRLHATVDAVRTRLARDGWLFRYHADEFGASTVAFILCTFWLVEALAAIGRQAEAAHVFERTRLALSPLGLLSEDYETSSLRMWGNFPQAYSHVGLIHAAFSASPRWAELM
ncbi:MAG TPA: glycoside hydrolase family 15 protein [Candidatus Polarisedimenticolia bacterium]|nr:glycoside hydrolase family 15 protein [Candidatus Polarisedimenticolia bacterium]